MFGTLRNLKTHEWHVPSDTFLSSSDLWTYLSFPPHFLCKYLILIDKIVFENDGILYRWAVIYSSFDIKEVFDHHYRLPREEEPVVSVNVPVAKKGPQWKVILALLCTTFIPASELQFNVSTDDRWSAFICIFETVFLALLKLHTP